MAKKTKAQAAAEAKEKELRNPITGQAPNTFTDVTNRPVDAGASEKVQREGRAVRPYQPEEGLRRRTRRAAMDMLATGEGLDAPVGYRMDAIDPRYRTFVTGARHMFPNQAAERDNPAINEPHEAHPGVTVQRRAEDLSGKEHRKGEAVLRQYGHNPRNPMESLREVHRRSVDRVVGEHIAAGVEESSSQMFYGGPPSTDLGEQHLDAQMAHEEGVMAAQGRFGQSVRDLATHPEFKAQTAHLSHRQRMDAATNLTAQATADTSPNTKWRDKPGAVHPWPNLDQADEAMQAAVEQRPPKFFTGRKSNIDKATSRVGEAIDSADFDVHQHGDPIRAAKTIAFRGALVDKDSPDAYKVADVHEASVAAPWLDTAKAHMHERRDPQTGEKVGPKVRVYADTPKREQKDLHELRKTMASRPDAPVPEWGLSRPEAMLNEGSSLVHALNDRATREVLAERGLSRGANYADNVHAVQAAQWGSQQVQRRDVNVSPADQYPVRRAWEREGLQQGVDPERILQTMPHATGDVDLGPAFEANPRHGRTQSIWPESR